MGDEAYDATYALAAVALLELAFICWLRSRSAPALPAQRVVYAELVQRGEDAV